MPNEMHIFRHKFISILFALDQKKMSLKSDQLEVSGSVFESPAEPPEISYTLSYIQRGVVLTEISGREYVCDSLSSQLLRWICKLK